jgi:DNA-binding MarR family transcriptional regulator
MDKIRQEAISNKLGEDIWIANNINEVDSLTRVQRGIIRVIYNYRQIQVPHIRFVARRLNCSAMAVSKALKRIEALRIVEPLQIGFSRKKYLRFHPDYPTWVNVVLRRLKMKTEI